MKGWKTTQEEIIEIIKDYLKYKDYVKFYNTKRFTLKMGLQISA